MDSAIAPGAAAAVHAHTQSPGCQRLLPCKVSCCAWLQCLPLATHISLLEAHAHAFAPARTLPSEEPYVLVICLALAHGLLVGVDMHAFEPAQALHSERWLKPLWLQVTSSSSQTHERREAIVRC